MGTFWGNFQVVGPPGSVSILAHQFRHRDRPQTARPIAALGRSYGRVYVSLAAFHGGVLVAAAVGLGLQFVALRLTLVGLVEALKRAIGMFFAVAVGRFAFEEPLTTGKVAGVVLMSAGVALIVL